MTKFIKRLLLNLSLIFRGKRKFLQSFNLFKYRISSRKTRLNYKPIFLTILPIHRCNLYCSMCLTHSKELGDHPYRHKVFPDMTIDMFNDIIKRFPEAIAIGFVGNGEPLLNKDIFKMIESAESAKMRSTMISNGIILEQHMDRILDSGLDEICISLNTCSAEDYERLTSMKAEYFTKICTASRRLIEEKKKRQHHINIVASFILDKLNLNKMQDMVNIAFNMGFNEASFYNILPLTINRARRLSLYDDDETLKIMREVKVPSDNIKINLPVPLDGYINNNICEDFFMCINIDGNGNVGGCNRQRFNIHDKGKYLDNDVWNNSYFMNERDKFLRKDLPLDEPCMVCYANSTYIKKSYY